MHDDSLIHHYQYRRGRYDQWVAAMQPAGAAEPGVQVPSSFTQPRVWEITKDNLAIS